jgi:hypothetical protein
MEPSSSSSSSSSDVVYVVVIDSRKEQSSSSIFGYTEQTTPAEYFRSTIVSHPSVRCHRSAVADMCGLDMKLYFAKYKKGLGQYYRERGNDAYAAMQPMVEDPHFLRNNNGIASWLTIDPLSGLPEWTVTGKAYVVLNDGMAPLSRGQVWGVQEMVNCLMDIYDCDPENIRRGRATLKRWADRYRKKTWVPPSGLGGMDIYSMRAGATDEEGPPAATSDSASTTTTTPASDAVYVVTIDGRKESETSSTTPWTILDCTEQTTPADAFHSKIVNHPMIQCATSTVAEMCGLDLKLYFMKYKKGPGQYIRESGLLEGGRRMAADNESREHPATHTNHFASWLTVDPDIGMAEWTVEGKAYVVLNDGAAPLSRGQVWGIYEMINCSMDFYDMPLGPDHVREGRETLERWAEKYRDREWVPPRGPRDLDIYSMRSGTT